MSISEITDTSESAPERRGRKPTCKAAYDTDKVCKLPEGHKGRHGEPTPKPEIPKDEFIMEDVAPEDRGNLRRQRIERSAQQKAVDAKVIEVWREWRNSGSQKEWTRMPIKTWLISERFAEQAHTMLYKATQLHGKKLVTGKDTPAKDQPGKVRIPYCVVDRKSDIIGVPENN